VIVRKTLACLAFLAVLTGCGGTTQQTAQPRPTSTLTAQNIPACVAPPAASGTVDRGLPDVTLDCLVTGAAVKLTDLRGKPTLINIWAQWCGPCRQEAPYLKQLADTVAASGKVTVLGVDIADPQPEAAVRFASEHGWRYPQLKDPDKLLMEPLNLVGPPATAFVAPGGEVRYLHLGPFTSYDELVTMVRDYLGVSL
jgi:cytochrome c biogenesis protein CcmG, thiol:disulfide interchange protein DsbE